MTQKKKLPFERWPQVGLRIVRDNGEEVMAKLMQAGDSYVVEGNTRLF